MLVVAPSHTTVLPTHPPTQTRTHTHLNPHQLCQVYGADEAFATGTFAGLLPVVEVDGRRIGTGGVEWGVVASFAVSLEQCCGRMQLPA